MAIEAVNPSASLGSEIDTTVAGKRRRRVNWPLLIGVAILVVIAGGCLGAPLFTHDNPLTQNLLSPGLPPLSAHHILGTDAPYGRDMLSRLLYGGRIDLLLGIGGTSISILIGTIIGLSAGFYGGRIDSVIMRIVDIFIAFPYLVLVLVIVAMLGPSLLNLLIAIWSVGWVSYARIIRGETLATKNRDYVMAARALGFSSPRIMVRHILPNIFSAALIFSMADVIGNILLVAGIGYLGLGVPEPAPEWGSMIVDGQNYMVTAWWVPTIPGLVIVIVGIAFSLIGDGLADILRPGG